MFKIFSGVAAILTAALWIYDIIYNLDYISFIIIWDAVGYFSIFDFVDYISILNWVLIKPVLVVISMIMCAFYAFKYYDKKQNKILGFSATILALWYIFTLTMSIVFRMRFTSFTESYFIDILTSVVITISFVLMSLRYLERIKFNIKAVPVIAVLTSISMNILLCLIDGYISLASLGYIIMDVSYIIPFMIIISFSPKNHIGKVNSRRVIK